MLKFTAQGHANSFANKERGFLTVGLSNHRVYFAYDGAPLTNRVENFTERKLYAAVVDNILTSSTYASRVMGMAKPFTGKVYDYTVRISYDTQGQWVTGMETLNAAAIDDTITLSYADAQFTQPKVSIMWESFDNAGPLGTINLDAYKLKAAGADALNSVATAIYQAGGGSNSAQINGLGNIVDNGTLSSQIGGQSRSTYPVLNAVVTASSGTLTLAKLATLDDDASATGLTSETPNLNLTTKTVWSLYESLLAPTVRANYDVKYLPLYENEMTIRNSSDTGLRGTGGFVALEHRGKPVIKDDKCADPSTGTGGPWFKLNERYIEYRGRTEVPSIWREWMEKVNLGSGSVYEGVGAQYKPSDWNGWFYRKDIVVPNQAGSLAYFVVMGQLCTDQPRRQAKLTGITGVA